MRFQLSTGNSNNNVSDCTSLLSKYFSLVMLGLFTNYQEREQTSAICWYVDRVSSGHFVVSPTQDDLLGKE